MHLEDNEFLAPVHDFDPTDALAVVFVLLEEHCIGRVNGHELLPMLFLPALALAFSRTCLSLKLHYFCPILLLSLCLVSAPLRPF